MKVLKVLHSSVFSSYLDWHCNCTISLTEVEKCVCMQPRHLYLSPLESYNWLMMSLRKGSLGKVGLAHTQVYISVGMYP